MLHSQQVVYETMRYGYSFKNYTLLERIGEGGEADIWSSWDSKNNRVIALRIIPKPDLDVELNITNDVQRQVDLLSRIDHPNVLAHYEFGTEEHFHYIAMRYCPVGSMADRIRAGPISLVDVMKYAAQITSALDYLHHKNIVHRDLNPSNLLIDGQERIYLADFGLAKLFVQDTLPMHTGRGTEIYAPFEQFARYEVVPQSDIYSLGITVFEMLTGKLPWSDTGIFISKPGEDSLSLPDLRGFDSTLPGELTDTLRQLTAYYWDQRPSNALEAYQLLIDASGLQDNEDLQKFISLPNLNDESLARSDGQYLMDKYLAIFNPNTSKYPARLTHFALIHAVYSDNEHWQSKVDVEPGRFILHGAIVHNYHLDEWWQRITVCQDRTMVCIQIIINEDEGIAGRALTQLLSEPGEIALPDTLQPAVLERLVDLASDSMSWSVRKKALQALYRVLPKAGHWKTIGITTHSDYKLATLALADVSISDQAAKLIGWVRSETAVNLVVGAQSEYGTNHTLSVLEEIQNSAGSLPVSVPIRTRLRVNSRSTRERWLKGHREVSLQYLLVAISAGLLVAMMMLVGMFSQYDTRMRDSMFEPYPVSNVLTIVEIADEDLELYGRWDSWPRKLHAELISQLTEAGARAILLDFVFAAETDDDAQLAEAIRNAGNVVQPVVGLEDAQNHTRRVPRYNDNLTPNPLLLAPSAAIGHTNIVHDDDGFVRQAPTIIQVDDRQYLSLAMAAIQVFLGIDESSNYEIEEGALEFAGRSIPVDSNGIMILNYAGPPTSSENQTYQVVNYMSVIDGSAPVELIKDKIILVGLTATGGKDFYLTPVSQGRPMAGIEILANYVETIWSSRFITRPGEPLRIALLILLGTLVGIFSRHLWTGLIATVVLALVYFIFASLLFDYAGIMLDLLYPFLVLLMSFFFVSIFRIAKR